MAQRGEFAIRFKAEDADKVRTALKGMGADGKAALMVIGESGEKASSALDSAARKAGDLKAQAGSGLKSAISDSSNALNGLIRQIDRLSDQDKEALAGPLKAFMSAVSEADQKTENWSREARRAFEEMRHELDRLTLSSKSVDLSAVTAKASSIMGVDPNTFGEMSNALSLQANADWSKDMVRETRRVSEELEDFTGRAGRAGSRVDDLGDKSDRSAGKVKKLGAEGLKAGVGLKAISGISSEVQDSMGNLADRLPLVGNGLRAAGPAGMVAAAGLAAAAAAAAAIYVNGRKAMRALGEIVTASENLNVTIEQYQALSAEATEAGVKLPQLNSMLQQLDNMSAQAAAGQGSLATMLGKTHPEIVKQIAASRTQAERYEILSGAIRNTTSQSEKQLIAQAAFGSQGRQMIRMLEGQADTFDKLQDKWRKAGLVLDEDLVRRVDEADTKFDILAKRVNTNVHYAFSTFATDILNSQGFLADLSDKMVDFFDKFKDVDDRASSSLDRELERINEKLELSGKTAEEVGARIAQIQARIDKGYKAFGRGKAGESLMKTAVNDLEERDKILAELAKRAEERAEREKKLLEEQKRLKKELDDKEWRARRAALEAKAAQIRAELGDYTGLLALREKDLNEVVKYGLIDKAQAAEMLKRYKEELDGTAAAMKRWQGVVAQTASPVQRLQAQIGDLVDDIGSGKVRDLDLAVKAMLALQKQLKEAQAAEFQTRPEYKTAVAIREELKKAAEDQMTAEEKLAVEIERVNAAMAKGGLAKEEGAAWLDLYKKQLQAAKEETYQLRVQTELLDQVFAGQIKTIEDVGQVFLSVLKEMVLETIRAKQELAVGQGFGDFLGSVFSAFGFGFGMKSGAGGTDAGAAGLGAVGKVFHSGGLPGDPTAVQRRVPASVFQNAPRYHSGVNLRPDEHAAILQDGERVLSAAHNERMIRAYEQSVSGGTQVMMTGGDVVLNVYGASTTDVETRQRRRGQSLEIDLFFKSKVANGIRKGDYDSVLSERFGINAGVKRRG